MTARTLLAIVAVLVALIAAVYAGLHVRMPGNPSANATTPNAMSTPSSTRTVANATTTSRPCGSKIIFWLVPWGRVDVAELPECSIPGVVVVIPCTPNYGADFNQFELSLSFIRQYKPRGVLFVNLFCAAPDWRGNLKSIDISYASTFLNALRYYLGEGSGIYIGFSEMTACVANATCRSQLAAAYGQLKSLFPRAKLYYYGTSSEKPSDILELAKSAGLDLVGEDIYDYVYNGTLAVPGYFLENLMALKSSGLPVMVGEVGFRLCDAQGYVQPWNWKLPIRERNCTATVQFYEEALSQLAPCAEYVGIWAWNDPTYGVALSKEVLGFFENYLRASPPSTTNTCPVT